jgi:ADP-ribose pyrophosphatase YjhB (NUDIX family)
MKKIEYCADAIAVYQGKLVLVERLSEPKGYALPGGRREQGEAPRACAEREFSEETGMSLKVEGELGTYDALDRDPRGRKISTVVFGRASGSMRDEPGKTRVFLMDPKDVDAHKERFAFDHYQIIKDWQKGSSLNDTASIVANGMDSFSKRIEKKKELYLKLLDLASKDNSEDRVFRIRSKALFNQVINSFGAMLDNKKAGADLSLIYEAGVHKKSGALIICNKGATLYSLSPRTRTPHITRHIGFCIYMPGLGIEFVNVGLVGDVYNGKAVLRTESACTPSFIYGSQRCNCAHQWESIRELAAHFNKVNAPMMKSGQEFELWVQKQFEHKGTKHIAKNKGPGFILMHLDTQNGMGSGYSKNEFAFDLYSRASMRHRGEYSSEQVTQTTMWGGFGAIGINPDPRQEHDHAGYKITPIVLDYLAVTRDIASLTNNPFKMRQLTGNGYRLTRIMTVGEVNLAGAQEAEQRGTEFDHHDITGECISFEEEFARLSSEIEKIFAADGQVVLRKPVKNLAEV